jgi:hypothetical protein
VENVDELPIDRRYTSKTFGDLAKISCVDRDTFQKWLTTHDLHLMLDNGWNPFANMLPPSIVKYLYERFIIGKGISAQSPFFLQNVQMNHFETSVEYKAKKIEEISVLCKMGTADLKKSLNPIDLHHMVIYGWNPFVKMLPPSVVKYLEEKFVKNKHMNIP